jgi:hypothetical protein
VLHVDRKRLASSSLWMPTEFVVHQSLEALRRGKLFVIPGWRYQVIVEVASKLPASLRRDRGRCVEGQIGQEITLANFLQVDVCHGGVRLWDRLAIFA